MVMPLSDMRQIPQRTRAKVVIKKARKCNECQGEHLYANGCPNSFAKKDAEFMTRHNKGESWHEDLVSFFNTSC